MLRNSPSCCALAATVCKLLLAGICPLQADEVIKFTVEAGKHDRRNTPVCASVTLPSVAGRAATVLLPDGSKSAAQVTPPSLLDPPRPAAPEGRVNAEIHFILPELPAGKAVDCTALVERRNPTAARSFRWQTESDDQHDDLFYGDRPVLQFVRLKFDESTSAKREETYKMFHHLYDPRGRRLVTKGSGGLYTHHRGLFYGFNKVTYGGGATCDIWHCKEAHQEFVMSLTEEAGPVLGRHLVAIDWCGQNNDNFANEQREVTAFNLPGGTLIEFASQLTPLMPPVKLDGDPQHAGFHFRAAQEVAEKTKGQTYYLRPDGKGKAGETRNWPDQPQHVDLPWDAMSFVLGDQRYTVAYLDRASNPKQARFGERDYGRFGSYFTAELTSADKTLDVNYRLWLQEGEMTAEQAGALAADFDDPPTVTVK